MHILYRNAKLQHLLQSFRDSNFAIHRVSSVTVCLPRVIKDIYHATKKAYFAAVHYTCSCWHAYVAHLRSNSLPDNNWPLEASKELIVIPATCIYIYPMPSLSCVALKTVSPDSHVVTPSRNSYSTKHILDGFQC